MNPEPTIELPLDYLVEISDDGKQPNGQEPEVLVLPPPPNSKKDAPASLKSPEQPPPA
jgi:hypothetical protein